LKDKESDPSTILPLTLWTNGFSFSKTVYASLHGVEDSANFHYNRKPRSLGRGGGQIKEKIYVR
jgi:hypothetical protein